MSSAFQVDTRRTGVSPGLRIEVSRDAFVDLALFIVPLFGAFQVTFVGQILLSDILVLPLTAVVLVVRGIPPTRVVYITIAAGFLWVLSLVVADIVNDTDAGNYLRGWARTGLAFAYIVFFVCATRPTPRSLSMLALGLAAGNILQALIYYENVDFAWFMKFYGGIGVTWILCVFAVRRWRAGKPFLPILGLWVWMLVALSQNNRSLMTIDFLAAGLMTSAIYLRPQLRRMRISTILFLLLAVGGGLGAGLITAYGAIAGSGLLGDEAELKYRIQAQGGNLLQIWNARPELRVGLNVAADSPILGHGSWYRNTDVAATALHGSGYVPIGSQEGFIQAIAGPNSYRSLGHSSMLQAWVEAGILGAAFWLWVIGVCVLAVLRSLQRPTVLSPLVFLAATALAWDALFSPFANIQRMTNMAELAIVLVGIMTSAQTIGAPRSMLGFGRIRGGAGPLRRHAIGHPSEAR